MFLCVFVDFILFLATFCLIFGDETSKLQKFPLFLDVFLFLFLKIRSEFEDVLPGWVPVHDCITSITLLKLKVPDQIIQSDSWCHTYLLVIYHRSSETLLFHCHHGLQHSNIYIHCFFDIITLYLWNFNPHINWKKKYRMWRMYSKPYQYCLNKIYIFSLSRNRNGYIGKINCKPHHTSDWNGIKK